MTWVKVDDRMPEHPKVIGLSDRAFRAHVEALCYCAGVLTDGRVPAAVAKSRRWSRSAAELVTARLWEVDGDGWRIHDYLAHQRSRQDADDLSEKRAAAGSRGGKARANAEANAKQVARPVLNQIREEEIREEEIRSDPDPPTPRKRGNPQPVDEPFIALLVAEYAETWTEAEVRERVEAALNHKASDRWKDKRLGVRGWLRRDAERETPRRPTPIRPPSGYLKTNDVMASRFANCGVDGCDHSNLRGSWLCMARSAE